LSPDPSLFSRLWRIGKLRGPAGSLRFVLPGLFGRRQQVPRGGLDRASLGPVIGGNFKPPTPRRRLRLPRFSARSSSAHSTSLGRGGASCESEVSSFSSARSRLPPSIYVGLERRAIGLGSVDRADQDAERQRLARECQRTEAACVPTSSRVLGAYRKRRGMNVRRKLIERV
jgi:hypothetical protein